MSERKPMTLEELRKMDGKPAYWLDDDSYGIISVESSGRWTDVPFFRGRKNGVNFEYNIKSRMIEVYAVEPPRLDRSAWEPCEQCRNGNTIIDVPACEQFGLIHNGKSNEQMHFLFQFPFCPHCGRPLTDAAWKMLEKRLEGARK